MTSGNGADREDGGAADWIAVDWGTSNLRAWAMDRDGRPRAEASSGAGMAGLDRDGFEPALLALADRWLRPAQRTLVVACGMVGAREGWIEAPYRPVPCGPGAPERAVRPRVRDPRLAVHVLPGLSQRTPCDVMRGEETQIAGLLATEPRFDGVACLPGTHTKWAHVSAGEVVSFATFMTGEIFALLARSSVLRHAVGPDTTEDADFDQAVEDALARPERVAARLFGLRAEALLAGLAPESVRARLSGLLIGLELAGSRPYWLGREVAIIGGAPVARAYARALARCGLEARRLDATAMTLAGLTAAHAALTERTAP